MAHVWNITDGNIYVSKNGNDTTGDGSMSNPYASINKATTVGTTGNKIVIGTGIWKEARGTSANKYNYYGDGHVVIYIAGSYFRFHLGETFSNLIFNSEVYGGYFYAETGTDGLVTTFNKCIINKAFFAKAGQVYRDYVFNDCLLDECSATQFYTHYYRMYFNRCTIIKYYISSYSEAAVPSGPIGYRQHDYFNNSIIVGMDLFYTHIAYYSNYYYVCFSDGIVHLNTGNVSFYSQYILGYLSTCIGVNASFNNQLISDYTLRYYSPCLFAGKNNTTIGAFGLGFSFNPNSSEFTKEGGATFSASSGTDDIMRASQTINGIISYVFNLNAGKTSGNVESAWIDLQSIRYLLTTRLFANLIYNASGAATSRPDNIETAGEKAVYYDFDFKYCLTEAEKATTAWKAVIWNKAVTIDNSNRGNADTAFVASEAKYISARFVKIKLYMREG